MHPLALASRLYYPGAAKVGEVPRDLRLPLLQYLDEVADADLAPVHEIQKSQAGWVGERGKQLYKIERLHNSGHAINIRLDGYVLRIYIRLSACEVPPYGQSNRRP